MTQHLFKPVLLDLLHEAQITQNTFFQELPEAELATIGIPDLWSAKDHVGHMTFWRQRLSLSVQAIIREEPQPESIDFEQQNPLIFEEQRYHSWSDILAQSDEAYEKLIALTARLTEEDLTGWDRFAWIDDGMPLYTSFMGNCYEHAQIHLAQYLLDRGELTRAIEIHENWTRRVVEAMVPDQLKGYMFYNLACFYATHGQLEEARSTVQKAFNLYPVLRKFALTDTDLVALRLDSTQ